MHIWIYSSNSHLSIFGVSFHHRTLSQHFIFCIHRSTFDTLLLSKGFSAPHHFLAGLVPPPPTAIVESWSRSHQFGGDRRAFSTSSDHIHCEGAKSTNFYPPLPAQSFKLRTCRLSIHLSACPTGFMTQMLQQLEDWNICGAFLFRPCWPEPQWAPGTG